MKPNKKRALLFSYGLFCLPWAYLLRTEFSVAVAGLFFLGALFPVAYIGPLAALMSIILFGVGSYLDATACIWMALLLQPPPALKNKTIYCNVAVALFWVGCLGVLIDRLNPCLIYTPVLYMLAGSLTAPALFTYLTRFIGWPRAVCSAIATAVAFLVVASRFSPLVVGARGCSNGFLHVVDGYMDMYSRDHNGNYPDKLGDMVPGYFPELPRCRTNPQGFKYEVSPDHQKYTISCIGPHFSGLHSQNNGWVHPSTGSERTLP